MDRLNGRSIGNFYSTVVVESIVKLFVEFYISLQDKCLTCRPIKMTKSILA